MRGFRAGTNLLVGDMSMTGTGDFKGSKVFEPPLITVRILSCAICE